MLQNALTASILTAFLGSERQTFTKAHVNVFSTFAQEFDGVIRHGNHNETNGIPIGPEVSRIFAEILFQEIDRRVMQELADLKFRQDYEFRRYVDDVLYLLEMSLLPIEFMISMRMF